VPCGESEGDVISFTVMKGEIRDEAGLYYVARHGLFALAGREHDHSTGGTVLTMRAWPST
jgi:hypothetical protein